MLADMVGASDPKLRQLSSRLAGRMMCEVATVGTTTSRGVGRIEALPFGTADGEIDLDASSEGLVELRAFRAMDPSKWKVRGWGRPSTAMCLLIDRSGSMTGERLAEAAIVAAAVSESVTNQRSFSPDDLSIAAFAREVIVIASADRPRHADGVVEDLLRMRGHGVTDLDAALQAAQRLLARSSATRKVTLLMSDCRSTTGPNPYVSAAMLDELCVLCPSEDTADAEALAAQVGAAWTPHYFCTRGNIAESSLSPVGNTASWGYTAPNESRPNATTKNCRNVVLVNCFSRRDPASQYNNIST